jgi:hypothetical protein
VTKENREITKGGDNDQVMDRGTPWEKEGERRPTGFSPVEIGVRPLGQRGMAGSGLTRQGGLKNLGPEPDAVS